MCTSERGEINCIEIDVKAKEGRVNNHYNATY